MNMLKDRFFDAIKNFFLLVSIIYLIYFCSTSFRTNRRDSINPLPALRLNDREIMANEYDPKYDTQSMRSVNSVTSINSLASLLKEKMQVTFRLVRFDSQSYTFRYFRHFLRWSENENARLKTII